MLAEGADVVVGSRKAGLESGLPWTRRPTSMAGR
jgi:hypothetical protein